jgi:hypothetical protein
MHIINRSAITVSYKQPFIDWHNNLMSSNEKMLEESSTYLIPELADNTADILKKYFLEIFETELFQMWTDENDWPPNITISLFHQWFRAEISGWVYDLGKKDLGRSRFDV